MTKDEVMKLMNAYMNGYATIVTPRSVTFAPREITTFKQEEPVNIEQKYNVCTRLTKAEKDALTEARNNAGVRNQSEAVREAIADWCQKYGVEFPHTPRNWGGHNS